MSRLGNIFFAAIYIGICLCSLSIARATEWHPEMIDGIKYVPMSDVRSHYKLTGERADGRARIYEIPGKQILRVQDKSQELYMNNIKFILSHPVKEHPLKGLMIANIDLHKVVDPVLRPTYIPNRRYFNTVIIDPGHGGSDSGARNHLYRESDLNLKVAQKLQKLLVKAGFNVVLTRDTDRFIPLQGRVDIANKYKNAIFVSIHFNAGRPSARGVETFTLAPAGTSSSMAPNLLPYALAGNAQDSMNIALATAVQGTLLRGPLAAKAGYKMLDRGIKRARYSVLCTIQHPAILVEGGFMSNAYEARVIATDRYLNFMAEAIAQGIIKYRTALKLQAK